eukprot:PhM_4_TR4449/c1_g1_i2/m.96948
MNSTTTTTATTTEASLISTLYDVVPQRMDGVAPFPAERSPYLDALWWSWAGPDVILKGDLACDFDVADASGNPSFSQTPMARRSYRHASGYTEAVTLEPSVWSDAEVAEAVAIGKESILQDTDTLHTIVTRGVEEVANKRHPEPVSSVASGSPKPSSLSWTLNNFSASLSTLSRQDSTTSNTPLRTRSNSLVLNNGAQPEATDASSATRTLKLSVSQCITLLEKKHKTQIEPLVGSVSLIAVLPQQPLPSPGMGTMTSPPNNGSATTGGSPSSASSTQRVRLAEALKFPSRSLPATANVVIPEGFFTAYPMARFELLLRVHRTVCLKHDDYHDLYTHPNSADAGKVSKLKAKVASQTSSPPLYAQELAFRLIPMAPVTTLEYLYTYKHGVADTTVFNAKKDFISVPMDFKVSAEWIEGPELGATILQFMLPSPRVPRSPVEPWSSTFVLHMESLSLPRYVSKDRSIFSSASDVSIAVHICLKHKDTQLSAEDAVAAFVLPSTSAGSKKPSSSGSVVRSEAYSSVSFHTSTAKAIEFGDEFFLSLPPHLTSRHHLLFRIYHVSCRTTEKKPPVLVGYAVMKLFDEKEGQLLNLDRRRLHVIQAEKLAPHAASGGYLRALTQGVAESSVGSLTVRSTVLSHIHPTSDLNVCHNHGVDVKHGFVSAMSRLCDALEPSRVHFFPPYVQSSLDDSTLNETVLLSRENSSSSMASVGSAANNKNNASTRRMSKGSFRRLSKLGLYGLAEAAKSLHSIAQTSHPPRADTLLAAINDLSLVPRALMTEYFANVANVMLHALVAGGGCGPEPQNQVLKYFMGAVHSVSRGSLSETSFVPIRVEEETPTITNYVERRFCNDLARTGCTDAVAGRAMLTTFCRCLESSSMQALCVETSVVVFELIYKSIALGALPHVSDHSHVSADADPCSGSGNSLHTTAQRVYGEMPKELLSGSKTIAAWVGQLGSHGTAVSCAWARVLVRLSQLLDPNAMLDTITAYCNTLQEKAKPAVRDGLILDVLRLLVHSPRYVDLAMRRGGTASRVVMALAFHNFTSSNVTVRGSFLILLDAIIEQHELAFGEDGPSGVAASLVASEYFDDAVRMVELWESFEDVTLVAAHNAKNDLDTAKQQQTQLHTMLKAYESSIEATSLTPTQLQELRRVTREAEQRFAVTKARVAQLQRDSAQLSEAIEVQVPRALRFILWVLRNVSEVKLGAWVTDSLARMPPSTAAATATISKVSDAATPTGKGSKTSGPSAKLHIDLDPAISRGSGQGGAPHKYINLISVCKRLLHYMKGENAVQAGASVLEICLRLVSEACTFAHGPVLFLKDILDSVVDVCLDAMSPTLPLEVLRISTSLLAGIIARFYAHVLRPTQADGIVKAVLRLGLSSHKEAQSRAGTLLFLIMSILYDSSGSLFQVQSLYCMCVSSIAPEIDDHARLVNVLKLTVHHTRSEMPLGSTSAMKERLRLDTSLLGMTSTPRRQATGIRLGRSRRAEGEVGSLMTCGSGSCFEDSVSSMVSAMQTIIENMLRIRRDPLTELKEWKAEAYVTLCLYHLNSNNVDLAISWLRNLQGYHVKNGDYSEAAVCCFYIAMLCHRVLELRNRRTHEDDPLFFRELPWSAFERVHPTYGLHIPHKTLSILADSDLLLTDVCPEFTVEGLARLLAESCDLFEKAHHYQHAIEAQRCCAAVWTYLNELESLERTYTRMAKMCATWRGVRDVPDAQFRYWGTFYLVGVFGARVDPRLRDRYFIRKTPAGVSIGDVLTMMRRALSMQGIDEKDVKLVSTKKMISPADLRRENGSNVYEKCATVHVVLVQPFFTPDEMPSCTTEESLHTNVAHFYVNRSHDAAPTDAPPLKCGIKPLVRTVVQAEAAYPHLQCLSPATLESEIVLSPMVVATLNLDAQRDRIQAAYRRVQAIRRADRESLDFELSALLAMLQGAVRPTVNAGIVPIIEDFLESRALRVIEQRNSATLPNVPSSVGGGGVDTAVTATVSSTYTGRDSTVNVDEVVLEEQHTDDNENENENE